jgi:Tol biopolymer transport system component
VPTEAASPTPAFTDTPAPTPTPAATPRGGGGLGQIAFASDRKGGVPQVFLINVAGTNEADRNITQVTTHPDGACQPAWSPDGKRLLFVSPCPRKQSQYPNSAIYIVNADGTNQQPYIAVGGVFDPSWSQSGIAYTFQEPSGRPRIWVADANGEGSHNISAAQSADSHPTWSGDGQKIAFVNTSATGNPNVYWMNRDGTYAPGRTLPSAVTPRDQKVGAPAWSPDSTLVAYVSNLQIWVIPWDKLGLSGQVQRTDAGPNDTPEWSPDSRHLVFESWRDNANHDIYMMNALTGGELVRLTTDKAQDFQPAWRP